MTVFTVRRSSRERLLGCQSDKTADNSKCECESDIDAHCIPAIISPYLPIRTVRFDLGKSFCEGASIGEERALRGTALFPAPKWIRLAIAVLPTTDSCDSHINDESDACCEYTTQGCSNPSLTLIELLADVSSKSPLGLYCSSTIRVFHLCERGQLRRLQRMKVTIQGRVENRWSYNHCKVVGRPPLSPRALVPLCLHGRIRPNRRHCLAVESP